MFANPNLILIIDDAVEIHEHLARQLRTAHGQDEIQHATSGEQAVRILESLRNADSGPPFLVFVDLKMPGMTGVEVLDWMQHDGSFTRTVTIVLTEVLTESGCEMAYKLGAFSCIKKPSEAVEIIAMYDVAKARAVRERKAALNTEQET